MLDLTIAQLEKIREALWLQSQAGNGGNGDLSALRLGDQVEIIIAGRIADARKTVAAQGPMHIELKGR